MLAYHLLSELYDQLGKPEWAHSCRRSVLPPSVVALPGIEVPESSAEKNTATKGFTRQPVYAAQTIPLPAPGGVHSGCNQAPRPALFDESAIKANSCFIDRVEHAVVWHDSFHTCVKTTDNLAIAEHTRADCPLIDALMAKHEPHAIEGRAFLIGARGAHNFYHWMADIAPKLAVLREAGYRFNDEDLFLVPFARHGFAWQILSQFGVRPEQIYETENQSTYLSVDELVVPRVDNKMGLTMGPWVPQLLREHFLPPGGGVAAHRRLFIDRKAGSADGRQIENQAALYKLLSLFEFDIVYPEEMPVVQQAILFAEADMVVAAHGAALANIIYCSAGTRIVEFYAGHMAPCYWAISALLELDYYQLHSGPVHSGPGGGAFIGQEADLQKQNQSAKRSGNLTVPLDEFQALLSKLTD